MSQHSKEHYRDRLELLQQDAQTRLERFNQHLRHEKGPVSADFAEQATEVENDETIAALHAAVSHELALIKSALQRIASDSYGMCEHCGNGISEERLDALPAATLCKVCAAK